MSPGKSDPPEGARLAVWQTGLGGLDWLNELVKASKAINLGGNGYPNRYTATAACLLPQIMEHPPLARSVWLIDPGDVVTDQWAGKTTIDPGVASLCRTDEWLLVEAWDESSIKTRLSVIPGLSEKYRSSHETAISASSNSPRKLPVWMRF